MITNGTVINVLMNLKAKVRSSLCQIGGLVVDKQV